MYSATASDNFSGFINSAFIGLLRTGTSTLWSSLSTEWNGKKKLPLLQMIINDSHNVGLQLE